jgi:hypothetical protein
MLSNTPSRNHWNMDRFTCALLALLLCLAIYSAWMQPVNADESAIDVSDTTATESVIPEVSADDQTSGSEPVEEHQPAVDIETDPPPDVPSEQVDEAPVVESPTVAPTEVPTDTPTLGPTETPTPTLEPTATVTPSLTSTPTATPKPFDPRLTCVRTNGGTAPVAGIAEPSWLDCTVTWETEHVERASVDIATNAIGWQIAVADPQSFDELISISDLPATRTLSDSDPGDGGFLSARFLIGSQLECSASADATIELSFSATSRSGPTEDEPDSPVTASAKRVITESGMQMGLPDVAVSSVSFSAIDAIGGGSSYGIVVLGYSGASPTCGWSGTVTFADFKSGDDVIPAASMTLAGVQSDFEDLTVSIADGVIVFDIPPVQIARPTSGSFSVEVELHTQGFVPPGAYRSTVTVQTQAPR